MRGRVRQRQCRACARAPFVAPLLQTRLARGNDRHLGQDEHAVDEDQQEKDQEFHRSAGIGRAAQAAPLCASLFGLHTLSRMLSLSCRCRRSSDRASRNSDSRFDFTMV